MLVTTTITTNKYIITGEAIQCHFRFPHTRQGSTVPGWKCDCGHLVFFSERTRTDVDRPKPITTPPFPNTRTSTPSRSPYSLESPLTSKRFLKSNRLFVHSRKALLHRLDNDASPSHSLCEYFA